MAKGAVGLVAGYWPEDVYRYLAVPGLSLDDGLVARPARRRAEQPALVVDAEALTYGQLVQDMERCSSLLREALGEGRSRVALVGLRQADLVRLLFGGFRARCVTLLLGPDLPPAELGRHLDAFQPDLVVAGDELDAGARGQDHGGKSVVSATELLSREPGHPGPPARVDLKAPAVALPGPGQRLVYHSHATLLAWAVSWSAFVPLTEAHTVLSLEPLHRWPGLMTALAVLFRGGTCLLGTWDSDDEVAGQVREHRPRYLLASFGQAAAYASGSPGSDIESGSAGPAGTNGSGPMGFGSPAGGWRLARPPRIFGRAPSTSLVREVSQTVEGVFVAIERPFRVDVRRQIESAFDVPVLTVVGNAASGPAVAAHPSWYLDESAGIPVTNVDLWPLHPGTGDPLAVPWEAVDYGQLGVRSPMLAVEHETAELRAEWVRDGWLRMGLTALMDPSGLFYLRPWR